MKPQRTRKSPSAQAPRRALGPQGAAVRARGRHLLPHRIAEAIAAQLGATSELLDALADTTADRRWREVAETLQRMAQVLRTAPRLPDDVRARIDALDRLLPFRIAPNLDSLTPLV